MSYKYRIVCSYHNVLSKSLCGATIISNISHFDSHSGHAQIPHGVTKQQDNAMFPPGKVPPHI